MKGKDFVRGDVRKDDGLRLSREGSPGRLQQLALAEGQTFNTRRGLWAKSAFVFIGKSGLMVMTSYWRKGWMFWKLGIYSDLQ